MFIKGRVCAIFMFSFLFIKKKMKIFLFVFVLFMIQPSLQQECISVLGACNAKSKACCSNYICYTGICVPPMMADASNDI